MSSTPIADLTYRNYDGELSDTRYRWWVIAKATIMVALRKRMLWWVVAGSAGYYLLMICVLFFIDQMSANVPPGQPNPLNQFLGRIVWRDQFVHGFSFGQMWFLFIALLIGAGSIANDNRANALLVYLSKPCDKKDYLFGKWFGVFLPLFVISAIPSFFFYFYGAMSYRDAGFISSDPWLFPKLVVVLAIGAAFNASLTIGFSSMFNQGRMAGAVYSGLYFLTNFFTQLMLAAWMNITHGGRRVDDDTPRSMVDLVGTLFYGSVDGIQIGMAKAVIGTDGSPYLGIPSRIKSVPMPPLWLMFSLIAGISAAMMFIAWRRIRPVEIVG